MNDLQEPIECVAQLSQPVRTRPHAPYACPTRLGSARLEDARSSAMCARLIKAVNRHQRRCVAVPVVPTVKWGTDVAARHGTVVGVVRVMDDPGEVAVALRGTALNGHPVEPGLGDTMLVEGVVPARVLESWRAARSVVALTGRWPVLTGVGELYHEPEPHEIAALERAARLFSCGRTEARPGSCLDVRAVALTSAAHSGVALSSKKG
ncbi:hypothetical protein [Dactylosporangium sp. CA-139066]|uniref:hypothetical protein n=1 Tax=Dactylosporangium sp. CA-139066 TaxID=3239930 RepID=UPI003D93CD7A